MKFIKFIAWDKQHPIGEPIPSVSSIPQWWKDGETDYIEDQTGEKIAGMKKCIPFMEIMMSGYVIVTPFDLYVTKDKNSDINIRWQGPSGWDGFVGERSVKLGSTLPRPAGHYKNGFVWSSQWSWKTPKGYSSIVTHPFNRFDLPFTTLSGTIDSDKFHANGNIPFFLKEGFEGIIPKGTPIAQVIPVKRKKWKSWIDSTQTDKIEMTQVNEIRSNPEKSYKKRFWQKKVYE